MQSSEVNEANRAGSPIALRLTALGLGLGLAIDLLFRRQLLGISFPIWSALSIAALLLAARWQGVRLTTGSSLLGVVVLVLSAGAALRLEPMTVALSVLCTWLLFALWIPNLHPVRLPNYGWLDIVYDSIAVPLQTIVRPWSTLAQAFRRLSGDRAARSRGFALLRGVLLALPILAVFVVLLSSADLVFRDTVDRALSWLNLEWLRSLVGHLLFIGIGALISLGALVTALRQDDRRDLLGEEVPLLEPFVGYTETLVVMAMLDLVFLVFVVIQFRYLFGGEANISAAGYTYAEYARRGFGEMVMVALLGQGLILGLGQWGRRDGRGQRRALNLLSAGLVAMLLVTLLSALTRLLLYEQAYGFTRSRTYAHVFIFWLAALLISLTVLLFRDQLRRYAPVCLVAGFGYALTLTGLNVDGFIASRNLSRYQQGGELDFGYLSVLTLDAVPQLAAAAGPQSPPELLQVLACQQAELDLQADPSGWQSLNLGRQRAKQSLAGIHTLLHPYAVESPRSPDCVLTTD